MRKITCPKCNRYDRGIRRCRDGMVNPKSYKQTKEVMAMMGFSYVCSLNRFKMKVIRLDSGGMCYHGGIA